MRRSQTYAQGPAGGCHDPAGTKLLRIRNSLQTALPPSVSCGRTIGCIFRGRISMRRLLTAVVSFVFFVAVPLAAQDFGQMPPLTTQVEVHVVNVDVTVTDGHGRPVLDLTKDDFEVLEDGHRQKVTNFSV